MIIKIKSITHERTEDAPFMGALICANDCKFNCKNCFNQELKNRQGYEMESKNIIKEVKSNKFNKGIILAGLEWTLQPNELHELIKLAVDNQLEVIVYSGRELNNLKNNYSFLFKYPIYIKYGKYIDELRVVDYKVYGVNLASSNQNIIKVGD